MFNAPTFPEQPVVEDNEIASSPVSLETTLDRSDAFAALIPSMADLQEVLAASGAPQLATARGSLATLRVLLFYVLRGHGARFACAWAVTAGLVEHLSYVWLLNLLPRWAPFFQAYTLHLLQGFPPLRPLKAGWAVLVLDASCVRSPQASAFERVHLVWELATGWYRHLFCPLSHGAAEHIGHVVLLPHTLLIADRLYCSLTAFAHVAGQRGALLVRWNRRLAVRRVGGRGALFDWRAVARSLGVGARWSGRVEIGKGRARRGVRLVIVHVGADFAAREIATLEAKKQAISTEAREVAPYLVLLSNAPERVFSAEDLVELYRMRWVASETELREAKSGLGFSGVQGKSEVTRRAWVWAHLCGQVLWQRYDARFQAPPAPVPQTRADHPAGPDELPDPSWSISAERCIRHFVKQAGRVLMQHALIPLDLRQWPLVRDRFCRALRAQGWRAKRPRALQAFLQKVLPNMDVGLWRRAEGWVT